MSNLLMVTSTSDDVGETTASPFEFAAFCQFPESWFTGLCPFSPLIEDSSIFLLLTVFLVSENVTSLIPESQLKLLTVLNSEAEFTESSPGPADSVSHFGLDVLTIDSLSVDTCSLSFLFKFVPEIASFPSWEFVFVILRTRRAASSFSQPSFRIFTTKIRSDISGLLKWSPIFSKSFSMTETFASSALKERINNSLDAKAP